MKKPSNEANTQSFQATDVLQVDRTRAAQMPCYSPATFDRLVNRGLIHANRATGRPRFSVAELRRFVDDGSRPL